MVLQKHMKAFRIVTNLALAGGFGLYAVAVATRIDRLSWDMVTTVLLNFLPYGICLLLDRIKRRQVMAACAAILLLTVDLWLFREIIDGHSFSAIPVIFYDFVIPRITPLVKLIFILPCGWLAGLLVEKLFRGTPKSRFPVEDP